MICKPPTEHSTTTIVLSLDNLYKIHAVSVHVTSTVNDAPPFEQALLQFASKYDESALYWQHLPSIVYKPPKERKDNGKCCFGSDK